MDITHYYLQPAYLKILEWAEARNLINGSKPIKQAYKLFSEAGELSDALGTSIKEDIIDGIGDTLVVTSIMAKQVGVTLDLKNTSLSSEQLKNTSVDLLHIKLQSSLNRFTAETIAFQPSKEDVAYYAIKIFKILNTIAQAHKLELDYCASFAYNEIKDRQGVMWQGTFVKSTNPNYEEILKQVNAGR